MKYKKVLLIIMIFTMLLVTGCGSKNKENEVDNNTITEQTSETEKQINVTAR
ncbi:MAG: hypothetical protein IKO78_06045 [Bacilli bacterium]|nr:hypothetical protein [Bacilli bacterium]